MIDFIKNQQNQQYELAIKYFMTFKDRRKLMEKLETSDWVFKIKFIGVHDNMYMLHNRTIYWNISSAMVLGDNKSVVSPALVLAHEMGHAAQHLDGVFDKLFEGIINEAQLETYNLLTHEIPIAKQLDEFVRYYYSYASGNFTVSSSTDHGIVNTTYITRKLLLWSWPDVIRTWKPQNTWTP